MNANGIALSQASPLSPEGQIVPPKRTFGRAEGLDQGTFSSLPQRSLIQDFLLLCLFFNALQIYKRRYRQDIFPERLVKSWLPLLYWFASFGVDLYIEKKRNRQRFGLVGKLKGQTSLGLSPDMPL